MSNFHYSKTLPEKYFLNVEKIFIIFINFQKFKISLTPVSTEKKVPPRHQSLYIGSTFDVDYRKPKVVGVSIFLHKEVEKFYFCIRHFKFWNYDFKI